jgi:glutamine cyclotransferase
MWIYLFFLLSALGAPSCSEPTSSEPVSTAPTPVYTYQVVNTYPHDPEAYTQGLAVEDTVFYEGTGLYGRSSLRRVHIASGRVEKMQALSSVLFGEGVTLYGNRLVQLTWQSHMGFVYDKDTFQELRSVTYPTEGWGITYDGARFIMSDGSALLYFRDPVTFEETGRVAVKDGDRPVIRLNELEYVRGAVYANVWQTDRIARIDPETGRVTGWIDLAGLLKPEDHPETVDVLNGIAYDPETDRLFVTGKLWPRVFEIRVVPR